jgi:hypothetical protein
LSFTNDEQLEQDISDTLTRLADVREQFYATAERVKDANPRPSDIKTDEARDLIGMVLAGTDIFNKSVHVMHKIALELEKSINDFLRAVELSPDTFNLSEEDTEQSVFLDGGNDTHPDMEYGRPVDEIMAEEPDSHIGTPDSPETDTESESDSLDS